MITELYLEVQLDVHFDYQPEEPMVRYYKDGSGYPGADESATVYKIMLGNIDVTDVLLHQYSSEEIEQLILNQKQEL